MLDLKCVFCPGRHPDTENCYRAVKFYFEQKVRHEPCSENAKDCVVTFTDAEGWTHDQIQTAEMNKRKYEASKGNK